MDFSLQQFRKLSAVYCAATAARPIDSLEALQRALEVVPIVVSTQLLEFAFYETCDFTDQMLIERLQFADFLRVVTAIVEETQRSSAVPGQRLREAVDFLRVEEENARRNNAESSGHAGSSSLAASARGNGGERGRSVVATVLEGFGIAGEAVLSDCGDSTSVDMCVARLCSSGGGPSNSALREEEAFTSDGECSSPTLSRSSVSDEINSSAAAARRDTLAGSPSLNATAATLRRRLSRVATGMEPEQRRDRVLSRSLVSGSFGLLVDATDQQQPVPPQQQQRKGAAAVPSGSKFLDDLQRDVVLSPNLRRFHCPHIFAAERGPTNEDMRAHVERKYFHFRFSDEERMASYAGNFSPAKLKHNIEASQRVGVPPMPQDAWAAEDQQRLDELFAAEFDALQRRRAAKKRQGSHAALRLPVASREQLHRARQTPLEPNPDVFAQRVFLRAVDRALSTRKLPSLLQHRQRQLRKEEKERAFQVQMAERERGFFL